MSFVEVSVNVCFGFVWFVSFVFVSFGSWLETGFRTRDSLGFCLLLNFSI